MTHSRPATFHFIGSSRPMGPGDFIWLAGLGCASRNPTTAEAVCACIETVAGGQWAPSAHLVCDCLDEMARARHLVFSPDGHNGFYGITGQGRGILHMMLSLPIERPTTPLGQVGTRLKLAFLDLAEPADRRQHLAELIASHRAELAAQPGGCDACLAPGCFGRMWSDHHTESLRRGLALLERMHAMSDTRSPSLGDGCSANGLHINCIPN